MRLLNKILTVVVVVFGALAPVNPAAASLTYTFTSGSDVAVTGSNYTASGALNLTLGFAPTPGTNLTVVKNTGLPFISGRFNNVLQGGTIPLRYNGVTYNYIANYYGGNGRSFVLQWPCVGLAGWGDNRDGQLGNYSRPYSALPMGANTSVASLVGKTLVAIAGGASHGLALASDGQVFGWGSNYYGQLGNASTTDSSVPVPVTTSGVLAGKTVVAIAGGGSHSLALTSDGKVFAWGLNSYGQLGSKNIANSSVPVPVSDSGALAGKTVVAITAGRHHSMALTADGLVFTWGANYYGQLGNGKTASYLTPVSVSGSGALASKTVVAIAAGELDNLALTSDGKVFAWGRNNSGQLGNSGTSDSLVPVAVDTTGALAGKAVSGIAAGYTHSMALTSDGQIFAWGRNNSGQLGNSGTSDSLVPVAVDTTGALAGKAVSGIAAGSAHSLALTSDGKVFAWGGDGIQQLGYDLPNRYFSTSPVLSANGELAGKVVASITAGPNHSLALFGSGPPSVTVNPLNQRVIRTGTSVNTVTFSAEATQNPASTVQWQVSTTGTAGAFNDIIGNESAKSGKLILTNVTSMQNFYAYRAVFSNCMGSCKTAAATLTTEDFNDFSATFSSAKDVFLTTSEDLYISGSLTVVLGFAPTPGTNLTVIKNSSTAFISGTFSNVPQGGIVPLTYNGVTYNYIANYYGGNGRSLVLQWPCMGLAAWGWNERGQIGADGAPFICRVPKSVSTSGALAGKTVVATAGGDFHSLALTADGLVFAWGFNYFGQLGNNSTTDSRVPVAVDTSGALAGKRVVAIAAGYSLSVALTSDGQVFAWGSKENGRLGNNFGTNSSVPVAVDTTGALAGKTVVAISSDFGHVMALTSDGRIFAWGYNIFGALGDNTKTDSDVPVEVKTNGVLEDERVVAIAAGCLHSLALRSDGQVFAWGYNNSGELGNSGTANSLEPGAVDTTGVLAGKAVVAIEAGGAHSLALTSDGQVFAWGHNDSGELGNSGTANSFVPGAMTISGALANKTVVSIARGDYHSLLLTSDGQVFGCGFNQWGEVGDNGSFNALIPVAVDTTGALAGKAVVSIAGGRYHSLALFGSGAPAIISHPLSKSGTCGATVSFAAAATDNPWPTVQWQVSTTGTGGVFSNITDNATATTGTLTLNNVSLAQNGYAYRAVFTNLAGSGTTDAATLTVQRTFDWFQGQYGLSKADPMADPNHTGICQLAAYAFGVNPAVPDRAQLPSVSLQNGGLQISYPRWKDAGDLGYVVEVSDDLQTWRSGAGYTEQVSVTPIDGVRERVVERDLVPTANASRRFIRVRVTH